MSHPFVLLSSSWLKALFFVSLAATLVFTIVLNLVGEPLITAEAPYGIISFELAGSPERAQAIIGSWDERAKLFASFSLGFDYLYMLAYSTLLGVACVLAMNRIGSAGWPFRELGLPLAWAAWLAALSDAIENLSLSLILLAGVSSSLWPALARICALTKFSLLIVGFIFIFYGLVASLLQEQNR